MIVIVLLLAKTHFCKNLDISCKNLLADGVMTRLHIAPVLAAVLLAAQACRGKVWIPLDSYYSDIRFDTVALASPDTLREVSVHDYRFVGTLGYVRNGSADQLIPLQTYWSAAGEDYVSVASPETLKDVEGRSGYSYVRTEGFISKTAGANLIPLFTFWKGARYDFCAAATLKTIGIMNSLLYDRVRLEGYLFASPPGDKKHWIHRDSSTDDDETERVWIPLDMYYSDARFDSVALASPDTLREIGLHDYHYVGSLGYIRQTASAGLVPLKTYWSADGEDYVSVASAATLKDVEGRSGYIFVRTEGYISQKPGPNLLPLYTFWKGARYDYSAAATPETVAMVMAVQYDMVRLEGWVFISPQGENVQLDAQQDVRPWAGASEQFWALQSKRAQAPPDRQMARWQELSRRASAAAASSALVWAASEQPDAFCQIWKLEPKRRQNFWQECCDLTRFDVLGNQECFPTWPAWDIPVCCAAKGRGGFQELWHLLLQGLLWAPMSIPPSEAASKILGMVTYHKTGTTLASFLVCEGGPGPLTKFFLQEPSELENPGTLVLHGVGVHQAPRSGQPSIWPYYQAYVRWYSDLSRGGSGVHMFHLAKPLQQEELQLQELVDAGGGRMIHLVRRASAVVVSGYRYHLKKVDPESEMWTEFRNPPSCLSCDHEAWNSIFSSCGFRCSYGELLRNSSASDGLGYETLRSRFDVLKMMHNARKWQDNPRVLQLSMAQFESDFDGTMLCVARFLRGNPRLEASDPRTQQLLEDVQQFDTGRIRQCGSKDMLESSACRKNAILKHVRGHMAPPDERESLWSELRRRAADWDQFLSPADALLDSLIGHSAAGRIYGCPSLKLPG
ncbi:unnamed protein product [Polarella glacialis]|uniref:Uncharacterized protein n=1 Tax=Polarella glacialis TaxID=89957 RepID=A0A813HE73_POLGL|nr:unnamed protein product [Polarella glacialis]